MIDLLLQNYCFASWITRDSSLTSYKFGLYQISLLESEREQGKCVGRNIFPGISIEVFLKVSMIFISVLLLLNCRKKMAQNYSGSNKIAVPRSRNNPEIGRRSKRDHHLSLHLPT